MKTDFTSGLMPSGWADIVFSPYSFSITTPHSFPALKIYLCLVYFNSLQAGGNRFHPYSSTTYDKIEKTALVARGEINDSLNLLEDKRLVSVHKDGRRNIYELLGGREYGWDQMPISIFKNNALKSLILKPSILHQKTRNRLSLDALRLYLLFLNTRDQGINRSKIGYDYIEEVLSIQRKRIKQTISLLVAARLIICENTFVSKIDAAQRGYQRGSNHYFIEGLQHYRPMPGLISDSL